MPRTVGHVAYMARINLTSNGERRSLWMWTPCQIVDGHTRDTLYVIFLIKLNKLANTLSTLYAVRN